jgi:hypothetical protein
MKKPNLKVVGRHEKTNKSESSKKRRRVARKEIYRKLLKKQ